MATQHAGPIVVTALDERVEFGDVDALAAHVAEILQNRGGIFDPLECAAIQMLAKHANGSAPERVHEIARRLAFHEHTHDARPAIPEETAAEIVTLEEIVAELEVRWIESRREREAVQREGEEEFFRITRTKDVAEATTASKVARLSDSTALKLTAAREEIERRREALRLARARLNALRLHADRWRYDQAARFYNRHDPLKPLTLQQLRES